MRTTFIKISVFIKNTYIYRNVRKLIPIKKRGRFILGRFSKQKNISNSGVTCIGLFQNQSGSSSAARSFFKLLQKCRVESNLIVFKTPGIRKIKKTDFSYFRQFAAASPCTNQIFFINADAIKQASTLIKSNRENIKRFGVYWWEFNDYFNFDEGIHEVDHIIVFSDFIKQAVEKKVAGKKPVTKLPYPFIEGGFSYKPNFAKKYREKYKISGNSYMFFYNFDLNSGFERKNPIGLIDAFRIVAHKHRNAHLVLKISFNNNLYPSLKTILDYVHKAGLADKVTVDSALYSINNMKNLIFMSDCYVSLHRSEGLGLGLAEAIQLGKPVIATNYGGNLEFMSCDTSYMVDYKLTTVKNDFGPYKKGFVWAEPSIEHAADCMSELLNNPAAAKEKGIYAKLRFEETYDEQKLIKETSNFCRKEFI